MKIETIDESLRSGFYFAKLKHLPFSNTAKVFENNVDIDEIANVWDSELYVINTHNEDFIVAMESIIDFLLDNKIEYQIFNRLIQFKNDGDLILLKLKFA